MIMSNKNVIQYLEDIESNVANKSISEQIGENFMKYLNNASVYYYESDLRKFNKEKKNSIYLSITILFGIFILLLINIILDLKGNFYIILYLLMMLYKIIDLILIIKTPNKRFASSNFNKEKIKFYEHNDILKTETSISFIFIIFSLVSMLFILGSLAIYIINREHSLSIYNLSATIILTIFLTPKSFNINYSEYIFELDNSYVVTNLNKWQKYDK